MKSAAASRLNSQLLQDNWITVSDKQSKSEAKISYLMVEQITPPEHIWDKISNKLDMQQQHIAPINAIDLSKTKTVALMVAAASTAVAAILYWLI